HHHAPYPLVGDEEVGAAPQHRHGTPFLPGGPQGRGQARGALGDDEPLRGAADAKGRVAGQGLTGAHRKAGDRRQPAAQALGARVWPCGNRRCAHPFTTPPRGYALSGMAAVPEPSPSMPSSAASRATPARRTLPAPMISTRSPACTWESNAPGTSSREGTSSTGGPPAPSTARASPWAVTPGMGASPAG